MGLAGRLPNPRAVSFPLITVKIRFAVGVPLHLKQAKRVARGVADLEQGGFDQFERIPAVAFRGVYDERFVARA